MLWINFWELKFNDAIHQSNETYSDTDVKNLGPEMVSKWRIDS